MAENKALFVSLLSTAFRECGNGRYDDILPLTYDRDENGFEWVYYGNDRPNRFKRVNVTLDSLMAILKDISRELN